MRSRYRFEFGHGVHRADLILAAKTGRRIESSMAFLASGSVVKIAQNRKTSFAKGERTRVRPLILRFKYQLFVFPDHGRCDQR
jgi:hypothetical protein